MSEIKDPCSLVAVEFDTVFDKTDDKVIEVEPITFWVPKNCKIKFEHLQTQTQRKFGREIKRVLISLIEKSELKD